MAPKQLEGKVLLPHIKAPVNPRPQLPQMPQRSAHTVQTRIEQAMVLPQTQLIPLTSRHPSGSPDTTQVECHCRLLLLSLNYKYILVTCEFSFVELHLVCQLNSYVLLPVRVYVYACAHAFPVVQTWFWI